MNPTNQTNQTFNPTSVQDLIAGGFTGYQGWNDNAAALADYKATGGQGKGSLSASSGGDMFNTPEIQATTNKINQLLGDLSKAELGINDNPFTPASVADRKINDLRTKAQIEIVPYQNQLKQLQDIAKTKYTAEQSANKTTLKTFTDASGNVNAIAFDSQGNIVNQTKVEGVAKGKTGTSTKLTTADKQSLIGGVASDAKDGHTLQEIVNYYKALGLSESEIYQAYNQNSIYGPAQETLAQVKQGKYVTQTTQ